MVDGFSPDASVQETLGIEPEAEGKHLKWTGWLGPYAVQAAIAAVHAGAQDASATDWDRIVRLYELLARVEPSPVVELNRAVAVAMREGPGAGLSLIDARDLDEAIAVAERISGARKGTVEIRPVHEIPGHPAKADER
jgi:predicted RNA polymerase sigma factor